MAQAGTNPLDGTQVVVIGGSSGIGLAVAKYCQLMGASVTIVSRSRQKLDHASASLGSGIRTAVADITDAEAVMKVFDSIERVDHVYVSAGTYWPGKITSSERTALQPAIDQYIWGPKYVAQHAAARMRMGSITFTSGQVSARPSKDAGMMSVGAAALEMLVKVLALELAPIRVNAVAPGVIDTPILGEDRDWTIPYAANLPVERIGAADEIAQAVFMLMTNGYVTGTVLRIDGGAVLI